MQVVIVTRDAASLRDALISGAPSPITYESPKPAAVMAEDKEIAAFPLKVSPGDIKIVKVEELFQQ
jgi:zinc protease